MWCERGKESEVGTPVFKRDQSYFSIPRLIMLVIVFACLELLSSTVSQSQEHGAEEKPMSTLPRKKNNHPPRYQRALR